MIVKVVPSSGRSAWKMDKSGMLKSYLKSPPEKNEANQELVKNIAKALKVPQESIIIIGGATSRTKRIKINTDITYNQVLKALGIEEQLPLFSQ